MDEVKKSWEPPEMRIVNLNVCFSGDEESRQVGLEIWQGIVMGKLYRAGRLLGIKLIIQ